MTWARGFDNMSDALTVTPALVQGYVRAASKISRDAVGDPQVAPTMSMYSVPKVVNQMRHVEGAPIGTRGGVAVVQNFPADGDYKFSLKLYHDYIQALYGQNLPANIQGQQIEVSVDGARVAIFTIDPSLPEVDAILTTGPIKIDQDRIELPQRSSQNSTALPRMHSVRSSNRWWMLARVYLALSHCLTCRR